MRVVLDLFVPCTVWTINAERRMHYMVRATKVEPCVTAAARLANNLPHIQEPVHADFYPVQAKRGGKIADTANHLPPCKAVLDGIVRAGVLVDDTPEYVLSQRFWPPVRGAQTGVRVVLTTQPAKENQ